MSHLTRLNEHGWKKAQVRCVVQHSHNGHYDCTSKNSDTTLY